MQKIDELKDILTSQFGPFIRNQSYKKAFDRSIEILEDIKAKYQLNSDHDILYMFMHSLIISLFEEINELELELTRLRKLQ